MNTENKITAPAPGLFGPGIFATGIDLSALDEDTAFRLGVWIGQQLHDRDTQIQRLREERDEAVRLNHQLVAERTGHHSAAQHAVDRHEALLALIEEAADTCQDPNATVGDIERLLRDLLADRTA